LKDSTWRFPAAGRDKAKRLHQVFDEYRASASEQAKKPKRSASELLGLYGLIRHYAETRLPDSGGAARKSFDACRNALDIIVLCKRGVVSPRDSAEELRTSLRPHTQWHIATYGTQHIRPKHHWGFDACEQIVKDGLVLDASW